MRGADTKSMRARVLASGRQKLENGNEIERMTDDEGSVVAPTGYMRYVPAGWFTVPRLGSTLQRRAIDPTTARARAR